MSYFDRFIDVKDLVGKTFVKIDVLDDIIFFEDTDGERYRMYHRQDCCESVYLESVTGDVNDLIGFPILMAEESVSSEDPDDVNINSSWRESFTWTFYKFATIKGYVDLRWYGTSDGFYSEGVSLERIDRDD